MLFLSFPPAFHGGEEEGGGGTRPEGEVEGGEVGRGKKGPAFSGEFSGLLLS